MPSHQIIVVLDSSGGVTYPLSLALSKASSDFAAAVGNGTDVTFPVNNTDIGLPNGMALIHSSPSPRPLFEQDNFHPPDVGVVVNVKAHSMACMPLYSFSGFGAALRRSEKFALLNSISFTNVSQAILINKDGFHVQPSIAVCVLLAFSCCT